MAMDKSATRMVLLQMGAGLFNRESLLSELQELEHQFLGIRSTFNKQPVNAFI